MGSEERRKKEREKRRGAILKAARRLFFEKGFKLVTVESIAKRAELSKGSIYLYFNSKEEIYTQILLADIERFHTHFLDILPNVSCAREALLKFAEIYVDLFLADRELFRILMTFMLHTSDMNLPDGLKSQLIKATNKNISVMEEMFSYGITQGEFPADLRIRQHRNAIWGLLNGIISLYLFTVTDPRQEDLIKGTVRAGVENYLRGLQGTK